MKKLIILIAIVLGIFMLLISSPQIFIRNKGKVNQTTQEEFAKNAILSVLLPQNESYKIDINLDSDINALDGLNMLAESQNLDLITKQYDFGTLVESIAGLESSSSKAWIYFINGESASVGADQYILKDKDIVEWKYIDLDGGDMNE